MNKILLNNIFTIAKITSAVLGTLFAILFLYLGNSTFLLVAFAVYFVCFAIYVTAGVFELIDLLNLRKQQVKTQALTKNDEDGKAVGENNESQHKDEKERIVTKTMVATGVVKIVLSVIVTIICIVGIVLY